ncbi:MAG: hypothetical protein HYV76_02260 [Candidatus Vogelbacteria bacterium]|nr:hypothetical protein [Candidatus Vogelbacteria bacterium]
MDVSSKLIGNNGSLYSAYILKGDRVLVREVLDQFISQQLLAGASLVSYPDFYLREYDSLGIEEARELTVLQSRRAYADGKKFFVISCLTLTREAQNVLLKTLEEPTTDTHFFFIIEGNASLLPTLLSRVRVVDTGLWVNPLAHVLLKSVTDFLISPVSKRLVIIENLLAEDEGAERKAKLGVWLALLEREFAQNLTNHGSEVIAEARHWLSIPGSIPKLLLEELALVLPVSYNQSK